MKSVKLKFNGISGYDVEEYDKYSINILGEFFCTEMRGGGFEFFYGWMKDPEWNATGGNIMSLKKTITMQLYILVMIVKNMNKNLTNIQ